MQWTARPRRRVHTACSRRLYRRGIEPRVERSAPRGLVADSGAIHCQRGPDERSSPRTPLLSVAGRLLLHDAGRADPLGRPRGQGAAARLCLRAPADDEGERRHAGAVRRHARELHRPDPRRDVSARPGQRPSCLARVLRSGSAAHQDARAPRRRHTDRDRRRLHLSLRCRAPDHRPLWHSARRHAGGAAARTSRAARGGARAMRGRTDRGARSQREPDARRRQRAPGLRIRGGQGRAVRPRSSPKTSTGWSVDRPTSSASAYTTCCPQLWRCRSWS